MTPLLWTYGLDTASGKWASNSPWRGAGGHIVFLDGHAEWYAQAPANLFSGAPFLPQHPVPGAPAPVVLNAMGK